MTKQELINALQEANPLAEVQIAALYIDPNQPDMGSEGSFYDIDEVIVTPTGVTIEIAITDAELK